MSGGTRDGALSERDWQAQVVELFGLYGWQVLHVRRSIGRRGGGPAWQTTTSIKGWPDLLLWHPDRRLGPIAVELKAEKGRLTDDQRAVLDGLGRCGVEVHVWRPSDWDDAVAVAERARRAAPDADETAA